ncbi:unnamed protein product [Gulo gulo]|uniref:Uncharacterized protein n=1 Tax=Gulo gulo TaxID=48420 RepID=A0A9X9PVV6_GULGU|nr:unnamed protein product [Gulo gulo]
MIITSGDCMKMKWYEEKILSTITYCNQEKNPNVYLIRTHH